MLQIVVPPRELYDEVTNEFSTSKPIVLQLEHSLISLSKWESKWHVPFLVKGEKSIEQTRDYVVCMTLNSPDPLVYRLLDDELMDLIYKYIEDPMSATILPKETHKTIGGETVTSELIYYWMVALSIPFECQKWHLNRLLTLINVCNIKNQKPKQMSRSEILARNREINEARRRRLNSKG